MTHLKEGDKAPDFSGLLSNGQPVSLSDYAGKKLVLYFYPKDDTPGCTAEACSLRDGYKELKDLGYEVLGVSPDPVAKHQKFIGKYELPFDLLADEDKSVLQAYGAWGPKKFMGKSYDGVHRFTFVIDENGIIAKVITKVNTKDHAAQVLDEMASV
ncbi:MAG: thioredoxin-dependent thiol peroxidase [Saprospiraceae bacterium]